MTLVAAICDEISFWRNDDTANPDAEILDAIRPGLVTTRGQLITLGSPYAKRGVAYETFAAHWGPNGDPHILVAKGATRDFNVTVPQETIDRAIRAQSNRRQVRMARRISRRHRRSANTRNRHLRRCPRALPIAARRRHLLLRIRRPSGGSTDEMTLAIAHRRKQRRNPRLSQSVRPPFSPDEVAAEFAASSNPMALHTVRGDRFGGDWPAECFSSHGIHYETEQRPRTDIYKDVVPLFTAGRVELLDDPKID